MEQYEKTHWTVRKFIFYGDIHFEDERDTKEQKTKNKKMSKETRKEFLGAAQIIQNIFISVDDSNFWMWIKSFIQFQR